MSVVKVAELKHSIDDVCIRLGRVGCEIVDLNEDEVEDSLYKLEQLKVQIDLLETVIRNKTFKSRCKFDNLTNIASK